MPSSISIALNLAYKLHKTLDFWSGDMRNFDFLEKSLGIFSPTHIVYDYISHVIFY